VIQIGVVDPNTVIWRYLTFPKFASVIDLGALWFSKLQILEDAQEGMTPEVTRRTMKDQHQDMENWFRDEERKRQVRRFVEDNEENGRELIVASCWFISEHESKEMWAEYAKDDEGLVIKSTAGDLIRALVRSHDKWWIGKVSYIDRATHAGMNVYEGHQAHLRAFLKTIKYSNESELRMATMNFVAPGCLNPDGSSRTEKQRAGFTYSPDRPGIYVRANLSALIKEVRTAPGASDSHRMKIGLLLSKGESQIPIARSELSATGL
jgi:hypothetical protein